MKKVFKFFGIFAFLFLIVIGVLVVASFLPIPGNFKIFTVRSGSMEPTIRTGSLILIKPEREYNVGDIITKKAEDQKATITHRILNKTQEDGKDIFETKGDANNSSDEGKIFQDQIVGKVFLIVPYVGYPVGYAQTPYGLVLLVIVPAVIIVYDEMNKIKKEIVKMRKRKREKKEGESEVREQRMEEKVEPVLEKKPQSQGSLQKNRPPQRNFSAPAPKKAVRRKMDL